MNYNYTAYSLILRVPFRCPALTPAAPDAIPDVSIVEGKVPKHISYPMAEGLHWEASPGLFLLRGGGLAGRFLVENGDRITLERNPGSDDAMLSAHLLTSVMAAILRQRGLMVLHANAAITPKSAIAISGEPGAGKSTTLAALLARGCTMQTDDITALVTGKDSRIITLPGIPKINLCEDAAIRLGHDVNKLPRNPLRNIKVIVPVQDGITSETATLKSLYILGSHPGDNLVSFRLAGADKFAALQECIYGPLFPEEHPGLFAITTAVVEQVEVIRIMRPATRWSVNEVAEIILNG